MALVIPLYLFTSNVWKYLLLCNFGWLWAKKKYGQGKSSLGGMEKGLLWIGMGRGNYRAIDGHIRSAIR